MLRNSYQNRSRLKVKDVLFNSILYLANKCLLNIASVINIDFLEKIKRGLLSLVQQEGFWEYYHTFRGKGLGAKNFSWTSALTLDLIRSEKSSELKIPLIRAGYDLRYSCKA